MLKILTPADLTERLFKAHKSLLVLMQPGCADCQVVKERVARLADRNCSLLVGAADATRAPGLARALGVDSFPTVVLFRKGQRARDLPGRVTAHQLQDLVDSVLW